MVCRDVEREEKEEEAKESIRGKGEKYDEAADPTVVSPIRERADHGRRLMFPAVACFYCWISGAAMVAASKDGRLLLSVSLLSA